MKYYLSSLIGLMTLGLLSIFPNAGIAAVEPVIIYQPTASALNQMYNPRTGAKIALTSTDKMNNAIIGDVDGDNYENDLVYTDSETGKLGYYKITGDGIWHAENDHSIPNTPSDAVPLAVIRVGYTGTAGVIVFRSTSTGDAYGIYPDGTALTSLGQMEKGFAVDARQLGVKGDLLWYQEGVGMQWREGPAGTDHPDPFGNLIPIGGGAIVPNQPANTLVFFPYGANAIYCCDKDWNYTRIEGANFPWSTNEGSALIGDIDNDGLNEFIYAESSTEPLSWYNVPTNGYPWNASSVVSDSNMVPGWNLRGVAYVETALPVATKIGNLRSLADGTQVELSNVSRTKLVWEMNTSSTPVVTGFYVEETNRTAGIRVMGSTSAPEGRVMSVNGTLQTVGGERVIMNATQNVSTTTSLIKPVLTTSKSIFYMAAMTGLLVRMTGSIVATNVAEGWFTLKDGSSKTIKVSCPGSTFPSNGTVYINGCVGRETDTAGKIAPIIRVDSTSGTDITPATGGAGDGGSTAPTNYSYCVRSSLEKVAKTDALTSTQSAALKAAKNEHEAFQIVLKGGSSGATGITVATNDLTGSAGTITASNVKVYIPWYINLPYYNRQVADPLPAYKSAFSLTATQIQPLWIDITVPKTAAAGDYGSSISITQDGKTTKVPFTLHVYNFTLPDESKLTTQFDFYDYYMAPKEGVTYGSDACTTLSKLYYEFLLSRGISTPVPPGGDFFGTEMANYLKDVRVTSFRIPYDPNPTAQANYFNRAKSLGVWDKGFCDTGDEPYTQEDYNKYKTKANYYHSIDPSAQCIVAYYSSTPDWAAPLETTDILAGYANIWCPIGGNAFNATKLAARKAKGEKVWMYTCTSPNGITPNYFLQDPAMSHRVIPWECYLHDASGWLYWHTDYWADVADPWTDICTGKGLGPQLYGEGSLLYPGKVHTGTAGPVSSIRLEVFRDGLEDYKYLWLLEQKIGRASVMTYVQKIAQSWESYTKDVGSFQTVRDDIAKKIEN